MTKKFWRCGLIVGLGRAGLAASIAGFLVGCELTPSGGSLYHASAEIGNTYALEWPRRVTVCQTPLQNCYSREEGNFTIDNAAITRDNYVAILHVVFANGSSGWIVYNDFLKQQFSEPAKTRLVAKLGMTAGQIKAIWGEPPQGSTDEVGESWIYPVIGTLQFKDGKLVDLTLYRSLLDFN
jgi:hypothetical protein